MVIDKTVENVEKRIIKAEPTKLKKNLSTETLRISDRGKRIKKQKAAPIYQKSNSSKARSSPLKLKLSKSSLSSSTITVPRGRIPLQLQSHESTSCSESDQSRTKRTYTKRMTEKIRRWTKEESDKYEEFINLNAEAMADSNTKRVAKIFIIMSQFLGTKTPSQCRSHHQKFYNKQHRKQTNSYYPSYVPNNWEDISMKMKMLSQLRKSLFDDIENSSDDETNENTVESTESQKSHCEEEHISFQDFVKNFNAKPSIIEENDVKSLMKKREAQLHLECGIKFEPEGFDALWDENKYEEPYVTYMAENSYKTGLWDLKQEETTNELFSQPLFY